VPTLRDLIATVWVAMIGLSARGQTPTPEITMETIRAAWLKREKATLVFQCETQKESIYHKDGILAFRDEFMKLRGNEGMAAITENAVSRGTQKIFVRDRNLRVEDKLPMFSMMTGKCSDSTHEGTYDGKVTRSLSSKSSEERNYPTGTIQIREGSYLYESASAFVRCYFLESDPRRINKLQDFTIGEKNVMIQGRPCIELNWKRDKYEQREVLYLDRERDFVLVSRAFYVGGNVNERWSVHYARHTDLGWAPSTWEGEEFFGNTKKLFKTHKIKLVSLKLNPTLPDELFILKFPPRTLVSDMREKPEVKYVIRDNGEDGVRVPVGKLPTYEDLVRLNERE
jgi:hypothetical protein